MKAPHKITTKMSQTSDGTQIHSQLSDTRKERQRSLGRKHQYHPTMRITSSKLRQFYHIRIVQNINGVPSIPHLYGVYAPTGTVPNAEDTAAFYATLAAELEKHPDRDMVIIVGDLYIHLHRLKQTTSLSSNSFRPIADLQSPTTTCSKHSMGQTAEKATA